MGNIKENQQFSITEQKLIPGVLAVLTESDLDRLLLNQQFNNGRSGSISIPRHHLVNNAYLTSLVDIVTRHGATIKERIPKQTLTPGTSGNIILSFPDREDIDFDRAILQAPLDHYVRARDFVKEINILPNRSTSYKLNGIVIKYKEGSRWWPYLVGHRPRLSRRLVLANMQIDPYEFAEKLDSMLNISKQIGSIYEGIKYIKFFHDYQETYMALAHGPDRSELMGIYNKLLNTTNSQELKLLLSEIDNYYIDEGLKFVQGINVALTGSRKPSSEVLLNASYTGVDTGKEHMPVYYCGATLGDNGFQPVVGSRALYLLPTGPTYLRPNGTRSENNLNEIIESADKEFELLGTAFSRKSNDKNPFL